MTTLDDLKKRATAAEAVLIERVEALVIEQAKADAVGRLKTAIEADPFDDDLDEPLPPKQCGLDDPDCEACQ
jgi:hypothetical protein